jgi:hypothetical protein
MSFDGMLIHTCTVVRPAYVADAYDNQRPDYANPVLELAGVRCRLIERQATWLKDEISESLVINESKLLFGTDANIRSRDRVMKVTLEDGTKVEAIFEVINPPIVRRSHRGARHLSAIVKRLS